MAIYQYNIDFFPRQAIVAKHGHIPTHLFIDHDAHEKHWEKDLDSDYDFEDALTIRWWEEVKSKFTDIEPLIDAFTKPIDWSKKHTGSRSYGNNDSNDIYFALTTEGFIDEFSCRIDLRSLDKSFIENLFKIAVKLDCLIMDRKGNLFEPTFDKFAENVRLSNSFKFVSNPSDFLGKLASGEIKPE